VNELMLRSDGTVAVALGVAEPVPPPPHAVAMIAIKLALAVKVKRLKSMGLSSRCSSFLCLLPGVPGRECAGNRSTQQPWRTSAELSIAQAVKFVKRSIRLHHTMSALLTNWRMTP
jgi:hypothetical protein